MEGNRSFKQVREDAVCVIERAITDYERIKSINPHELQMQLYERREVYNKISFACVLGLISQLEADEYYIRIDMKYAVKQRA